MTSTDPTTPSSAGTGVPALELRGLRKRFGDLVAVDGIDLSFEAGEVHALLGENGAGKSTLMNLVAGFLAADAGEVLMDGQPARFGSPRDALAAGVGMVHQHFRLVDQFTVAENLAIGSADRAGKSDRATLVKRASSLGERFGLEIDPEKPLWRLSVGEKQRVEILRALARGAGILVLDEPTAVLTPPESEALCRTLRAMAADGTTVIFISHKLKEVVAVADRVSVMRRGRLIRTLQRDECDIALLARLMIGETEGPQGFRVEPGRVRSEDTVLEARNVSVRGQHGVLALDDVSLAVRRGEIVGIAGVAGNGQRELEEVLTGLRRPDGGQVLVADVPLAGASVRRFIDAGLAHIPEDRKGMGLMPTEPLWRNAVLKSYRQPPVGRGPVVRTGEAKRVALDMARRVNLSTQDVDCLVQHLSGGNAQKLLVGRELAGDRRVVVAVNPTQGLDVGAVAAVWRQLIAARDQGLGVLMISADLDEVLNLSDRVLVQYEGCIVGEFARDALDREQIGILMGGGDEERTHG